MLPQGPFHLFIVFVHSTPMSCRNHPNTRVEWLRHNYKGDSIPVDHHFGMSEQTRMAIEGGHSNQSVYILHLDSVTVGNSGVFVCRDQCGFMQKTLKIQQLGA